LSETARILRPPYLPTTRPPAGSSPIRDDKRRPPRLLRAIRDLPCMVMISGYWSQMYAHALKAWNVTSYEAMTRGGPPSSTFGSTSAARGPSRIPFSGKDFRERERIKRQKARWTARLLRMPPLQRQALLLRSRIAFRRCRRQPRRFQRADPGKRRFRRCQLAAPRFPRWSTPARKSRRRDRAAHSREASSF